MGAKAGTPAEIMEEHCLLLCSPWVAQAGFYTAQDHCLGTAPPPVDWALPLRSLIKEIPHRHAYRQYDGDVFSAEVPSS